jgi:hypothetical protein
MAYYLIGLGYLLLILVYWQKNSSLGCREGHMYEKNSLSVGLFG